MTTTEQARELAERLKIKHGDPKPTASVLYDAARVIGELADQVERLTGERDALREAAIKVVVSASELNITLDGNEAMRSRRQAVLDASTELLAALNAGGERG